MSLLQITFRQNFEFKRLIPLERIKIADISIILERSQKCVIDTIEVKMLKKKSKRDYLTAINKNLEILARTRSYFSILIFCPPIAAFPFFD
jgi:hypothetical protein